MEKMSAALFSRDVRKAAAFYQNALGQNVLMDNGLHIMFTSGIALWDAESAFATVFGASRNMGEGDRFELCLESDDIDADYDRAVKAGAKVITPLAAQPWAQLVFRVRDPDGHLIEVGERLSDTVLRLQKDGLSREEISARTHIEPDTLQQMFGDILA